MADASELMVMQGIVYQEGSTWVARCLTPVDHTAQAASSRRAIEECIAGVVEDMKYASEHGTEEYLRPAPLAEWLRYLRLEAQGESRPYAPREVDLSDILGTAESARGVARFSRTTVGALP